MLNGNIMEKPVNCDETLYELMKECWIYDKWKRLSFWQLVESLLLQLPDTAADKKFRKRFKQNSFYYKNIANEIDVHDQNIESLPNDIQLQDLPA